MSEVQQLPPGYVPRLGRFSVSDDQWNFWEVDLYAMPDGTFRWEHLRAPTGETFEATKERP